VFHTDRDTFDRQSTQKLLQTLKILSPHLGDYLHLIIPSLIRVAEQNDIAIRVRVKAMESLDRVCKDLPVFDYISRIVHPLIRILGGEEEAILITACMDVLCTLIYQVGSEFSPFLLVVRAVVTKKNISHLEFDHLSDKVESGERICKFPGEEDVIPSHPEIQPQKTLRVNEKTLKAAWETTTRANREDWASWMRRFSMELLRESPSPALRSCSSLANLDYVTLRELFNAGFLSCWNAIDAASRLDLVKNLERALFSDKIPPEILQKLLDLAEFMERMDQPLPISISTLGDLADKCHAYAKALYYKEREFRENPSIPVVESLISINNKLGQPG